MNDQEQQPQMNPEDPSALLPKLPKVSMGKGMKIGVLAVVLFVVLALLHFSMKSQAPTETIRDTPSGAVVTITPPPGAAPAPVPQIVKDKDGREYLTGELIVAFSVSVPVEEAKKRVASAGGVVKQHLAATPIFLVGITDAGAEGVNKAILKFQTMPGVEHAEPNYLTKAGAQ